MKDCFDREISDGNLFAYAGTSGRSAVLNFYRVSSVGPDFVRCFKYEKYRTWRPESGKFNDFTVTLRDGDRMLLISDDEFNLMTK